MASAKRKPLTTTVEAGSTEAQQRLQASVLRAFEASLSKAKHQEDLEGAKQVAEGEPAWQLELALAVPAFPEDDAIPNSFARSALFPAQSTKLERPYLDGEPIFAIGDMDISFTGRQLGQDDLDVWLAVMRSSTRKNTVIGEAFEFSTYEVLRDLGRGTGGHEYESFVASLIRLSSGTIVLRCGKLKFWGSLIEGGFEDQLVEKHTVRLNRRLAAFFGMDDAWSRVSRAERAALGKNRTAQALHMFYSTHAKPYPYSFEKLAAVAGLRSQSASTRNRTVRRALDQLVRAGFLKEFVNDGNIVSVIKAGGTPAQRRHLRRQSPKARRRSPAPPR